MRRPLLLTALTLAALLATSAPAFAHHYDYLLAPTTVCGGQLNRAAPAASQEKSMACMYNYARGRNHLARLATVSSLTTSSGYKSADIMRCQQFSHYACGRSWDYWLRKVGYITGCYGAGENIAWGSGSYGNVRSIMSAWLHSDGHRENILNPRFRNQGIGLVQGKFLGYSGAQVWTAHLGWHC